MWLLLLTCFDLGDFFELLELELELLELSGVLDFSTEFACRELVEEVPPLLLFKLIRTTGLAIRLTFTSFSSLSLIFDNASSFIFDEDELWLTSVAVGLCRRLFMCASSFENV